MSKLKVIIVSGYFNPIHKGHLEYFNNAKKQADKLFVIVNNDNQRKLKGSKYFQDENERMFIVSNIKAVDEVILSIDTNRTVCKTIESIAKEFGDKLSDDKKTPIEEALAELKTAHTSKDLNAIDSAMEKINEAWKVASEEMYKATEEAKAADNANTDQQEASGSEDVTDVDFEEVKEDK